MSHWRWTPISNSDLFRAFSTAVTIGLALAWVLATAPGLADSANADDEASISAGPVSAEEAQVLWKDGKADFEHGMDEDAISKLERFVARYPGYPGYTEARHWLAKAYLRQHEPAKAKNELKAFIQAQGRSPDAIRARCELARADLELKLFHEAFLTADEAMKITLNPKSTEAKELHAEALYLRAVSQLELGQESRARTSNDSARESLPSPASSHLSTEIKNLDMRLKLGICARFPSKGPLQESQVRDQLGRRGTCLLESLLSFKNSLEGGDANSSDQSTQMISEAYASYWEKCLHPPSPPPIHPKNRDAQQLKTYFRELAVVLEEDCRQKIRQGQSLLNSWKGTAPAPVADSLSKAVADLEKLK